MYEVLLTHSQWKISVGAQSERGCGHWPQSTDLVEENTQNHTHHTTDVSTTQGISNTSRPIHKELETPVNQDLYKSATYEATLVSILEWREGEKEDG